MPYEVFHKPLNKDNRIAEWLLPLLEKNGMSVEQLAKKTGLTRTAIYNYLADIRRPTVQSMAMICKALHRPLSEGLNTYKDKPWRPN